ncbi:MAG TPA: hypothetical protein VEL80_01845 [Burkholderiales bacterium]|nr:hypothetical protein [Burkholderiales bacterium]
MRAVTTAKRSDGRFTINAGIPTYGVNGMFRDPDGGGVHGLDERIRVRSLYEGHEFLYRLGEAVRGWKVNRSKGVEPDGRTVVCCALRLPPEAALRFYFRR